MTQYLSEKTPRAPLNAALKLPVSKQLFYFISFNKGKSHINGKIETKTQMFHFL